MSPQLLKTWPLASQMAMAPRCALSTRPARVTSTRMGFMDGSTATEGHDPLQQAQRPLKAHCRGRDNQGNARLAELGDGAMGVTRIADCKIALGEDTALIAK